MLPAGATRPRGLIGPRREAGIDTVEPLRSRRGRFGAAGRAFESTIRLAARETSFSIYVLRDLDGGDCGESRGTGL